MQPAYDIFLSHSKSDLEWVRNLAQRIQDQSFQGRPLRAWFDERHLNPGDFLRPEIDAALASSRYCGVVLTSESAASRWVNYEWNRFYALHPGSSRIIPLLLRPCVVPVLLAEIKHIAFGADGDFDASLSVLLDVLRRSAKPSAEEVRIDIAVLARKAFGSQSGSVRPTPENDDLYAYISTLDVGDIETEGLALSVFKELLLLLKGLTDSQAYDAALLIAECLALRVAVAIQYNRIVQDCCADPHRTAQLVGVRAYSKLAELNSEAVDTSALLYCADQLDKEVYSSGAARPEVPPLAGHIGRAIGKMKNTPNGQNLICSLATRGSMSRWIAAGAISFDLTSSPPIQCLSAWKGLAGPRVRSEAPSPRLLRALALLMNDRYSLVQQAARTSYRLTKKIWPTTEIPVEQVSIPMMSSRTRELDLPLSPYESHRVPFIGHIYIATTSNMYELSKNMKATSVFCLSEEGIIESLFYGCSGMLITQQACLSHLCVRLRGAGIPFAMLELSDMKRLRDGAEVIVDSNGIHVSEGDDGQKYGDSF